MGSSKFRKAIGAVKDQTTIGLAKVGSSASISDLEIAIVKATRHEEYPAEERHIREVISLTSYSRSFISVCVDTISRRLNKTRNWTVALKTLILVQRLLMDGDAAYEQEIFFATRRGTRILNMSDFRDSRSELWDCSAFVRTYALYLDERLEYRMQRRRGIKSRFEFVEEDYTVPEDATIDQGSSCRTICVKASPVKEMTTEGLFSKMQHLQQLLDRILSCKPSGAAKHHRVVLVALYPAVKDSFHIYYEMSDILGVLIERFMELPIDESVRVYDVFCRAATQLDELESFHVWSKSLGLARSSEYPDIDRISSKKLDLMDDFIRDKTALLAHSNHPGPSEPNSSDLDDQIKPLPPLPTEELLITANEEPEPEPEPEPESKPDDHELTTHDHHQLQITEGDLLNLEEGATTPRTHENQLALALFDGDLAASGSTGLALPPPAWEVFKADAADWESALIESASSLNHPHIRPALPGGFDVLLLDGMYQQSANMAAMNAPGFGTSGSASSVALGSAGRPAMLALPAPPSSTAGGAVEGDPFAASLTVAPPSYVQMSDLEYKQRLLLEEQRMWEQYNRNGRQAQVVNVQHQNNSIIHSYGGGAGGYTRGY